VLRPQERKHDELEVVRVTREQITDTVELAIGQAECSVERLFDNQLQRRLPL
jgi:hypothetical protein